MIAGEQHIVMRTAEVPRGTEQGLGDAPWPPHYRKQENEPPRVRPSKRKTKPLLEIAPKRRKKEA